MSTLLKAICARVLDSLPAVIRAVLFTSFTAMPLLAQRDAPVYEAYLPRFSIFHDDDGSLIVDFAFRKNGGPYEHTEHQCYVLAYLKSEEENIMKLAADPSLSAKKPEKSTLLEVLLEKKLAVALDTKVAKLNSPTGKTPRFPDVTGKPAITGAGKLDASAFLFQFGFKEAGLFEAVNKLAGFDSAKADAYGDVTDYEQRFKLMLFIPVNDSKHADKVSPAIRSKHDFAYLMNTGTALLYFRPLPYELEFTKHKDGTVKTRIN